MFQSKIYIGSIRISKLVIISFLLVILFFFFAGLMVTSFQKAKSSIVNYIFLSISDTLLVNTFPLENIHFQIDNEKTSTSNIFNSIFSTATTVKFNDLRSFISQEIPGFNNYYKDILVAGEGTDITNIPIESNISMEDLQKDFGVNEQYKDTVNNAKASAIGSNLKKEVLLYYSHTRESFLPMLNGTNNPNEAYSTKANVTLLGERFKNNLEKAGVGTITNNTDIVETSLKRGLTHSDAYRVSREVILKEKEKNKNLTYLIDIHRDASRKKITTKNIKGKAYARLYFIVGIENPNFKKNLQMTKEINNYLDEHYYGISRGIFPKSYADGNGLYNQDLSPNAILVEIGGVDNNLDELNSTIDVLTEAFLHYYKSKENN
ncbi:MAG: stage II sporulation protein P [Bacillaceae bacterium]